jgi:hypothetical protein
MVVTAIAFLIAKNFQVSEPLDNGESPEILEVNRDIANPVYPGSTFEVVLNIEAERTISNLTIIEETGNISVTSSPSGSIHNNSISWYLDELEGNHTVKYRASLDADRFSNFNLSGRYENGDIRRNISGEREVNISP